MGKGLSEDARYKLYRYGAHGAWWSAVAWTGVLTWVNLSHPVTALPNLFQRVSGLFILLLMGFGISLGSALSRMRLARTIESVFEVGMDVAALGSKVRQEQIIHLLEEERDARNDGGQAAGASEALPDVPGSENR